MRIFIFLLMLLFSFESYAGFEVEFKVSKMHGLWNFMETIAGDSHKSKALKKVFEQSKYNDANYTKLIDQFKRAKEPLLINYDFEGYPQDRHAGQSLRNLFLIRSAFAKDLNDFSEKTLGLIPLENQVKIFNLLKVFLPIYDSLVWNDNASKLRRYKNNLSLKSKEWGLNILFLRALLFYRASWPKNTPFIISLYPIPGDSGHSSGESIGVFQSVGVLVDEKDIPGRFGVLFHEICHALYESQSLDFQKKLESYFKESKSKYASITYQYLNEGLATALGNGFAYEKAAKKMDKGKWYNDDYIDGFAKAIYPDVIRYLEKKKPLDKAFAESSIDKFSKAFPDSIYDYSSILNKIFLATDGTIVGNNDVRRFFNSDFNVSSIHRNTPIDHPATFENIKESGETVLIIVTEKERQQLNKLISAFDILKEIKSKESEYIFSKVDEDGRAFIVIVVKDQNRVFDAMKALKKAGHIDSKKPFMKF